MNSRSRSRSQPPRQSRPAKHAGSSTQPGITTLASPNQPPRRRASKKTNLPRFPGGVHKRQEEEEACPSTDGTQAEAPYLPIARPWASRAGYPSPTGLAAWRSASCGDGASGRDVTTPIDRWIAQDTGDEAWNDVLGVYGTYHRRQDDGVDVVDDGSKTNWSGNAVCGSEICGGRL